MYFRMVFVYIKAGTWFCEIYEVLKMAEIAEVKWWSWGALGLEQMSQIVPCF